jgi:hypothetical protein
MLPAGLTADLTPPGPRALLQQLHPPARTIAQLLVGACSCDLVRPRLADSMEDERELRARYQRAKLPRADIIQELERHRRRPARRQEPPPNGWAAALAAFAVEHARNAGPTLYLLHFGPRNIEPAAPATAPAIRTVSDVRQSRTWLPEGHPVVVR